jgi:hypothetical protein
MDITELPYASGKPMVGEGLREAKTAVVRTQAAQPPAMQSDLLEGGPILFELGFPLLAGEAERNQIFARK